MASASDTRAVEIVNLITAADGLRAAGIDPDAAARAITAAASRDTRETYGAHLLAATNRLSGRIFRATDRLSGTTVRTRGRSTTVSVTPGRITSTHDDLCKLAASLCLVATGAAPLA